MIVVVVMMVAAGALSACSSVGGTDPSMPATTDAVSTDVSALPSIGFAGTLEVGEPRRYEANLHCGVEWLAGFNDRHWKAENLDAHLLTGDLDPVPRAWLPVDPSSVSTIPLVVELVDDTTLHAAPAGSSDLVVYRPAEGWVPCM